MTERGPVIAGEVLDADFSGDEVVLRVRLPHGSRIGRYVLVQFERVIVSDLKAEQ